MSSPRFTALGSLASGPNSRAFLGYESGPAGPLWPVVMIWVPEEVTEDPDRLQQLREDTARAARLDHPNIIRVLGCEPVEEGHARVVEFADGENLRRVLRAAGTGYSASFLCRVVADACAGLHHAHEVGHGEGNVRGRLHGALRPETLLVGFDGVTKVTGYGALAVAPRDVFGAQLSQQLQYRSPEEIEGGAAAADRRSDVYALALTLYEGLTDRLPFPISDRRFEANVLSQDPPAEPLAAVSNSVREVVLQGLARQPARRFPTADAFRKALEEAGAATTGEMAHWMSQLFPPESGVRMDRRTLLRSAGFGEGSLPRPTPSQAALVIPAAPSPPSPAPPVPAEDRPAKPIPKSRPQPVPPTSAESGEPEEEHRSNLFPMVLGAALGGSFLTVAVLIILFFLPVGARFQKLFLKQPAVVLPPPRPVLPTVPAVAVPPEPPPEPPPVPEPPRPAPKKIGHPAPRAPLARASMEISAPAGSQIWLDGRTAGVAPIQPMQFNPGRHVVKVTMGRAVFERSFDAQAGETLTLDVHPTSSSAPN